MKMDRVQSSTFEKGNGFDPTKSLSDTDPEHWGT